MNSSPSAAEPVTAPRPRKRRFLQVSLRTMLAAVTILAILLGLQVRKANNQRRATEKITALGGTVYHFTHLEDHDDQTLPTWIRQWIGEDYFRTVEYAELSTPRLVDADLEFVGMVPYLKTLLLVNARQLTDAAAPAICQARGLKELHLDAPITDASLETLSHLDDLNRLDLVSSQITDAGLPPLARLSHLKILTLTSPHITDAGLADLKNLPLLEEIHLDHSAITDEGLRLLTMFPNLKGFVASETPHLTGDGLGHLAKMTRLKTLGLNDLQRRRKHPISDDDLRHLQGLTNLEFLDLGGSAITDDGLKRLAHLTRLKSLAIGKSTITGAGLAHLASLAQLRVLHLEGTKISDKQLVHLIPLRRVIFLTLSDNAITDDGLDHVKKMLGLKVLLLDGTEITDAGLKKISVLTGIHAMRLDRTNITDAGLKHLKPMQNLAKLWLSGTPITDEGLAYLHHLPLLRALDLSDTQVTPAGVARLQQKRPGLVITLDGGELP